MKTLYLECGMGASGDMLTAALLELHPNPTAFLERINSILPPGVKIAATSCVKCGIRGTRVIVTIGGSEESAATQPCTFHGHEHNNTKLTDIEETISHMNLPEKVSNDVLFVYSLIAKAEATVHGMTVPEIHFHEVGSLDAIADITAVSLLINELSPGHIISSPICVGNGNVRCAHGILPVPAPATAEILRDIPIYGGKINSELCTPTGAALLRHFSTEFAPLPLMRILKIGYGMGKKDFEHANCLRAMIGESL